MVIVLVLILSLVCFSPATPKGTCCYQNSGLKTNGAKDSTDYLYRNGTTYPIKLATSPEEEQKMLEEMKEDLGGRLFKELFQDNSDSGKKARAKKIRFLLRFRNNLWVPMESNGSGGAQWNKGGKVKVLIHGLTSKIWKDSEDLIRDQHMFEIGEAYKAHYNTIIVDWTSLSKEPLHKYYEAAASTWYAGIAIAEFLIKLRERNLITSWKNVHLIGHSLGAHVAGVVGYHIAKYKLTKSKLGRITGVDPAGPLFDDKGKLPSDTSKVLDKSDAGFVDIMHCNMGNVVTALGGRLGSTVAAGHADFYPNGGETQKGCSAITDQTSACSHDTCVKHYVNSIKKPLLACPCDSWEKYTSGNCKCTKDSGGMSMGERCTKGASGKYYL